MNWISSSLRSSFPRGAKWLAALCGCAGLLGAGGGSSLHLDVAHPAAEWRLRAGEAAAQLVTIDVLELVNPALVPLSFAVAFRPADGESVPLGTYGPYPADKAGRFSVPAKGLVQGPGTVLLSLRVPASTTAADAAAIRVTAEMSLSH